MSSLVSSLLKGTALGVSMSMLVLVPSMLAERDTGSSNNSTTPPALPGVSPSPAVNLDPSVNPSQPMDSNTFNSPSVPQRNSGVPMNNNLPAPTNDNNGIPGAAIDLMEDNTVPSSPNNLNNLLGLPENEPLPNSRNTNRTNSNQPSQSNNSSTNSGGNSTDGSENATR